MFQASLLDLLTNDSTLTSFLSTYTPKGNVVGGEVESIPSIFFNSAPEKIDFTYLTFKISDVGNDEGMCIDVFALTLDVFDYGKSSLNVTRIMQRLIDLLDHQHITNDTYLDTIRLFKEGSDFVESGDPLAQHFNMRFSARAGRSGWMKNNF